MSPPRPDAFGRRAFLRGAGVAVALPWLESLRPLSALAGAPSKTPPLRVAFLYVPNGADMANWTPKAAGASFSMPHCLEPLQPLREHVLVLSGLAHKKAEANGDGPGDHARAGATFLTGCQAYKTSGANLRVGVSVDQAIARRVASETRLPSLELGLEPGAVAGECDSGYSCAYSSNLSWRTESSPMAKEVDPRSVFDRMFGDDAPGATAEERAARARVRASVLDYVLDDAKRLSDRLGASDRRKMDEYLEAVRELERRVARATSEAGAPPAGGNPAAVRATALPREFEPHAHLMLDLLALAFQADVTRVATFMMANEGSNRSYPEIGVPNGHHEVSHHAKDTRKVEMIRKINRLHVSQFGRLIDRMRHVPEGDGTLLDHTILVYGSCIGDGDRHNHDDLPILVAGRGNGAVHPGRHVRVDSGTPVANLWLSLLSAFSVPADRFGDSTGRLTDL